MFQVSTGYRLVRSLPAGCEFPGGGAEAFWRCDQVLRTMGGGPVIGDVLPVGHFMLLFLYGEKEGTILGGRGTK